MVAGWLLAALVASVIAGAMAGAFGKNPLLGWLIGLAVQAVFSERAARWLAGRFPGMPAGIVGAVCTGLVAVGAVFGGVRSIPLTLPLGILLFMSYRLLGQPDR